MTVSFFSTISIPKITNREGGTGKYARVTLPGYGFWYPSGSTFAFPNSEAPQSESLLLGQSKPESFRKDCCGCD
jgi:hypothetical protein